jgi:hypothetical protein
MALMTVTTVVVKDVTMKTQADHDDCNDEFDQDENMILAHILLGP